MVNPTRRHWAEGQQWSLPLSCLSLMLPSQAGSTSMRCPIVEGIQACRGPVFPARFLLKAGETEHYRNHLKNMEVRTDFLSAGPGHSGRCGRRDIALGSIHLPLSPLWEWVKPKPMGEQGCSVFKYHRVRGFLKCLCASQYSCPTLRRTVFPGKEESEY